MQEFATNHCTPMYKAPELFTAQVDTCIDERTDIWSLGCTLFAIAYIVNPFEADTEKGSISLAVSSAKLNFPKDERFSTKFNDFIRSLINPDYTQRPFIDAVIAKTKELLQESIDSVTIDIKK